MLTTGMTRGRPRLLPAVVAAVLVLAAGLAAWDGGDRPLTVDAVPAAAGPGGPWFEHDAPPPVRVRSDAVAIDAPTIPLGKRDDGRLEVPEDAHTAGWWTGRADPGERGPAVIVGHVDSRQGPGAFWELPDLAVGDRVSVDREDGTSVHWRVERVEQHPKDAFPTDAVYGHTDEPTLRLVTCSGTFDREARRYLDNTVVFLRLDPEQDFQPQPPVEIEGPRRPEPPEAATTTPLSAPEVAAPTREPGPVGGSLAALEVPPADGDRRPLTVLAAALLLASSLTLWRAAVGPGRTDPR